VHPDDAARREGQRNLVRLGYDTISRRYRDDTGAANPSVPESTANYRRWLGDLGDLLQPGASILDLGCGAGVPGAKLLVDRGCRVTGVDISAVQIERARALVPGATLVQADLATWDSEPASFDAIVSLYALIHVPLEDQRRLIPRLIKWLTPAGYLLAIVGHERWTGIEDYMGAPMFWEHADADTYLRWVEDAGFTCRWMRYIAEGTSGHTLMLAQVA
jgi:cyclopropane fatty-acyl-phospholipid synthase-like methyltransferase